MCRSGICDRKPVIFLKRSSLEPNLLQSVYRKLCMVYRLVTNLMTYRQLFLEQKLFHNSILHPFCQSTTKFGRIRESLPESTLISRPIETYSLNFVNFRPGYRDTMQRHASVFHCCFSTTSHVLRQF